MHNSTCVLARFLRKTSKQCRRAATGHFRGVQMYAWYNVQCVLTRFPRFVCTVFDSMGKPSSGIMEASLSFLGVYSQCVGVRSPVDSLTGHSFDGQYCLANVLLSEDARNSLMVSLQAPSASAQKHRRTRDSLGSQ